MRVVVGHAKHDIEKTEKKLHPKSHPKQIGKNRRNASEQTGKTK